MHKLKSPIKWHIYWFFTRVSDWNIPVLEQIADFIRDKTWVYEDHKDLPLQMR